MGRWNHTVNGLRDFITEEGSLKENALGIFNILDADSHFSLFSGKNGFRECPEDITADDFDDLLAGLYDYCDLYRIWIAIQ